MSAVVVAGVVNIVSCHHICFSSVVAAALKPHKAVSVSCSARQQHTAEAFPALLGAWSRTRAATFLLFWSRSLLVCRYIGIWASG